MRTIIADGLGIDDREITMDSRILEDLGIDGLMFFILSYAIKEKLKMNFNDEEYYTVFYDGHSSVRKQVTVRDLCVFVESKSMKYC